MLHSHLRALIASLCLFCLGCAESGYIPTEGADILRLDSVKGQPLNTNSRSGSDAFGFEDAPLDGAQGSDDASADVALADADITDSMSPEPEVPPKVPNYPHFNTVIDLHRGDVPVWAHYIDVDVDAQGKPSFHEFSYGGTADALDFWPASTIKIYPATAALVLLKKHGFSLDAEATFYHQSDGVWVEDITATFRDLIFESFNCSSNTAYTLLLRFTGIDWLNMEFFTAANGFDATTLMVGYVSDRPYAYKRYEPQRIVIKEGAKTVEREHTFSGTPYHSNVGCTVSYGAGAANCSSPRDMAEHMKRVMFHEFLNAENRFDANEHDLDWLRYEGGVMNNKATCGGPGWWGVKRVLPEAEFYHKGGAVTAYRLDLQYVENEATDTRYILAIATKSKDPKVLRKLSEEVARMAQTPNRYVHLDFLDDHVNPVEAGLLVYSDSPGQLELRVKGTALESSPVETWNPLPGTTTSVPAGFSSHTITSDCLTVSEKFDVRGAFVTDGGISFSDLHTVIVDSEVPCSQ